MRILYTPLHAGHHVRQFIRLGKVDRPREIPARVERTLDALREAGHQVSESPSHGMRPIADVHTPEYLRFLETAWTEWRRIEGAAEEVLPYVFPLRGMTGATRRRWSDGPGTICTISGCRSASTPGRRPLRPPILRRTLRTACSTASGWSSRCAGRRVLMRRPTWGAAPVS